MMIRRINRAGERRVICCLLFFDPLLRVCMYDFYAGNLKELFDLLIFVVVIGG